MDQLSDFQELTGITNEDVARDILRQFDWDILQAVNFIHCDAKPVERTQFNHILNENPPPHTNPLRVLNFEIILYLNEKPQTSVSGNLTNVSETLTVGELKQAFISSRSTAFNQLALENGLEVNTETLKFDGLYNQGDSSNDVVLILSSEVTLKSLHLPLNNKWIARLNCKSRSRIRKPHSSVKHRICLSITSLPQNGGQSVSALCLGKGEEKGMDDGDDVCTLSLDVTTTLISLKQRAFKVTHVPVSYQLWSTPSDRGVACGSSCPPNLIRDLNSSKACEIRLRDYHLKSGSRYNLIVEEKCYLRQTSPAPHALPSTSHRLPSQSSDVKNNPAPELDEDVAEISYYDMDDSHEDDLICVRESINPYSVQLIPADLANSPLSALENFYNVFLQRYCTDVADLLPPFTICSFEDAIDQSLKTASVSDRKPLFIYLHDDNSVAVHIFCQQVLCSSELCRFLNSNSLKIWPWDVTNEVAKHRLRRWLEPRFEKLARVVTGLQQDRFPVLVMVCRLEGMYSVMSFLTGHGFLPSRSTLAWSSSSHEIDLMQAIDAFSPLETSLESPSTEPPSLPQGNLDVSDVVGELWQKLTMYQERLKPEVYAEQQRAEREIMRNEQDRAYKESLERDRLKIEAKQREEEAAARREDEMREEEVRAQREARNRQVASTHALPLEPPADTPGVATIRFRLPTVLPFPPSYQHLEESKRQLVSNGMVVRRFRGDETLCDLKNFMESLGYSVVGFKLLTTFPRTDLTMRPDDSVTVAELKLVPQETLILEQR